MAPMRWRLMPRGVDGIVGQFTNAKSFWFIPYRKPNPFRRQLERAVFHSPSAD
jgi:hypothetical protein